MKIRDRDLLQESNEMLLEKCHNEIPALRSCFANNLASARPVSSIKAEEKNDRKKIYAGVLFITLLCYFLVNAM